ncbi:MAG: lytic transglycosylase domain-containing protein [Deltaproteobacteria bacterium]|nr:lytic transglycosylase domain-containing protein [Deltaproteobacteria bacterium]
MSGSRLIHHAFFVIFFLSCGHSTQVSRQKTDAIAGANKNPARFTSANVSERCEALKIHIQKASDLFNVEIPLIAGIIKIESNFNIAAKSSQGAMGLMQVMAKTAKMFECGDLYDPYENIMCGTKVLKRFLEFYDGNIILALSGYHAGHFFADTAKETGRLPENFDYVEKVLSMRAKFIDSGCLFK